MQVIMAPMCESITGKLYRNAAYSLQRKIDEKGKIKIFAKRNVKYNPNRWSDQRHLDFILQIAKLATNPTCLPIQDVRVSVRELVDAHTSTVTGQPLDAYPKQTRNEVLNVWCGILTLCAKHSKPTTIFNAQQVLRVEKLLRGVT